ncbi:hypothetical protein GCM10010095_15650 [Streptomyces anthocyanicus]|nr:hypothetical protein JCM4020_37640 [Streptomyces coelicolor]BDE40313.1 hypothetical protein SLITK23_35580 [Streptomyces lividans]GGL31342.1 hypothetical protein GCM10010095_15650 [Streptomyces anthocyanicus]GHA31677.1 hypothetical protein GCM10010391_14360 [Streptomyces anthocyanicus]GHC00931.1 hypothetical protein GCM10010348_21820 [Streptomyces anthocyanicus]
MGLASSLLSDAPSMPQEASEKVIRDAATDMAIRRARLLTALDLPTHGRSCSPGDPGDPGEESQRCLHQIVKKY